MALKRRILGGVLAVLGFMLSPLSWWNDAFVNLPLALAFAWLVTTFAAQPWKESVFETSVIVGYWLTNVLGFVLMRRGGRELLSDKPDAQQRSNLTRDLLVSLIYTLLLVVLLKLGVLRAIENYFSTPQLK